MQGQLSFPVNAFLITSLLLLTSFPLFAQAPADRPEVYRDIYHDTSAPAYAYTNAPPMDSVQRRVRPIEHRHVPGMLPTAPDRATQSFALPRVAAAIGKNFDGLSDASNGSALLFVPSDNNIAVGATQVVETINTSYRVINKSTGATSLSRQISSLFSGMSGLCGQGATSPNFSDPVVLYDKQAARWFISIVALTSDFNTGNQCIAVSSTSNATGTYHRYAFTFGTNLFNDYPKFGVWPDAYYASYNMFTPTAYAGAKSCAYKRSAMLAGTAATAVCFTTTQQLDSLGDRLMFRMPYRNFGTRESLVITHSVKTSTAASAIRWYEIRTPNTTPSVFQKGTFGAGSTSLWMGSIAMDKVGDIAVGFSKSSSTTHPGIGYTGRTPSDPAGTLESMATIFTGGGSQTGGTANGGNRWGDYSSLVLDPSNDCTFWYVNQYIPSNGSFNFRTRLASFKFPGCI